jgi:large exoprotein involved in heme utilization and adhesion
VAINDSQLNATTGGIGNGGSITVGANTLSLSSQNVQTSINASTFPNSAGNGGAIQLTANNMSLDGNSLIIAKTQGSGNAGDITIAATNISLNGRGSTALIAADTLGPGKAGLIDIGVNQLTLGPGSQISTSSGADIDGQGRGAAGTIEIHGLQGKNLAADSVTLSSGGIFSSTQGQGVGGDVSILANMVMLDGKSTISADTASPFSSAVGGDITITANTLLSMKGGSTITAGSLETQTVTPKANAGSITITAPTFTMDGAGTNISATTEGTGIAGNITANVGTLAMTNGASISSSSTLTAPTAGNAGNITLVSTQDLFLTDSTVQTSAAQATGGNITLTAPGIVLLDNSKLTSSVNGPVGSNGGNITIDPQFVILRNNSQILAQANAGQGGNITIVATGAVLEEPGSVIDASSALGINGEVDIHAPIQQLSGTIVPLPQAYGNIATLYGQHCAAQKGGQFSSFVQRGRDGVPPQPRDYIPSPLMFELSETPPPTGTLPPPSLPAVRLGMSELGQPSPTSFTILSGCRS